MKKLVFLVFVILLCSISYAQTITTTYAPTNDAYVTLNSGTVFGTQAFTTVNGQQTIEGYYMFANNITDPSSIVSAVIYLNFTSREESMNVSMYRINTSYRTWDETLINGLDKEQCLIAGNEWNDTVCDTEATASIEFNDNSVLNEYYKFNVTDIFIKAIQDRSSNFSVYIKHNITTGTLNDIRFTTKEATAGLPYINITYINTTRTISFSNYKVFNNTNYVRVLNYTINLTCPFNSKDINISLYVNGYINKSEVISCTMPSIIHSNTYTHGVDNEYFDALILFNDTLDTKNSTFLSDITNPAVTINMSNTTIFNSSLANISMTCTDSTMYYNITYNLTFNNNLAFYGNKTNDTIYHNDTVNYIDGTNTLIGKCSDMFGTTTRTITRTVYTKILYLIDELSNSVYDLENCTNAKAYIDNNRSVFDFKLHNVTQVNFTSSGYNKLRFVIEREDENGDIIKVTKYVDVSLLNDEIRVCANKHGLPIYQQLIISASQKPAVLVNLYSNCVIAADYTRFGYQDALVLEAHSIDSLYYLYTIQSGNQILLSSMDGSLSTYINLDQLEFGQEAYDLTVLSDVLTFQRVNDDEIKIYYNNLAADNTDLSLVINRMDTNEDVFSYSDFADYNEFTLYFDYSTLSNVTNATLFRATLTKTTDSGTSTIREYFNIFAKSGVFNAVMASVISFILMAFGFTLVASRLTLGWFGLIICIAAWGILSFTVGTWYTLLLQGIYAIIFIFCAVIMLQKNYSTLT